MNRTTAVSFILLMIVLIVMFYGWAMLFLVTHAGAETPRWRCWAEKKIRHGEARCTAVFDADNRAMARRYAAQLCVDECGGPCDRPTCTPHRGN